MDNKFNPEDNCTEREILNKIPKQNLDHKFNNINLDKNIFNSQFDNKKNEINFYDQEIPSSPVLRRYNTENSHSENLKLQRFQSSITPNTQNFNKLYANNEPRSAITYQNNFNNNHKKSIVNESHMSYPFNGLIDDFNFVDNGSMTQTKREDLKLVLLKINERIEILQKYLLNENSSVEDKNLETANEEMKQLQSELNFINNQVLNDAKMNSVNNFSTQNNNSYK